MSDMRTPWTLESDLKSTELTAVLDADGNRVAQWVPREKARLMAAAPDMLLALQTIALWREAGWQKAGFRDEADMREAEDETIRAALRRATGADQ